MASESQLFRPFRASVATFSRHPGRCPGLICFGPFGAIINRRLIPRILLAVLAVLVGVGLWKTSAEQTPTHIAVTRECSHLMGTDASLAAVVPQRRADMAERCLREAEAQLRGVESRMSTWIEGTEVSKLNAAPAGQFVPLSAASLDVLRTARDAHAATGGAFDVTCRPPIELWRRAAERGTPPDAAELAAARDESAWQWIELTEDGAVKRRNSARVDLGGIAKGYAIDRAAEAIRAAGVSGGMVDVGGDLVCFGRPISGGKWNVDIQDPFGPGILATVAIAEGAVCTSGNYARFVEIGGVPYSHILDPRTGIPVDSVASATVLAPTAMTADIWATALSVLGPDGWKRLPEGVEALMIVGTKADYRIIATRGFLALVDLGGSKKIRLVGD